MHKPERATERLEHRVTPTLKEALKRFSKKKDMNKSEVMMAGLRALPGFEATVKEVIKEKHSRGNEESNKSA